MSNNRRGMALIELLVAITLMSLLSVGMLMSLRLGFNAQERVNGRLYDNRRVVAVNRILDAQVAGIMAVPAECLGSGQLSSKISFFQGEPQTMRFVSAYSLEEAHRGLPRILEFQVIPGDRGIGVRLIVNESYYNGPYSTGHFCTGMGTNAATGLPAPQFIPVQINNASFVMADKLAYCRMWFREALKEPPYERWLPVWGKAYLPSAIRIEMAPLPQERMRLPLVTLTMPIRVTRDPLDQYVDLY